jgi:malonyl-CoA/methylmalonyl-CoA synthetase
MPARNSREHAMAMAEQPGGTASPLLEWLARRAEGPPRTFLTIPGGEQLSYQALAQSVARHATALQQLGVGPGERVLARLDKSAQVILLYLACLRLGAVFVPVNPGCTAPELEYLLRDAAPCLALVAPSERGALEPLVAAAGCPRLETAGAGGEGSLAERARRAAPHTAATVAAGAVAAILYTSGTTGRPKGAMLSHANLAANAATLARAWGFSDTDVLLHALPLFHVHGLFVAINTVLAAGARVLLLPRFDAAAVLQHLPAATVFMGVPTHYSRLLQERALDRTPVRSIRLFVCGSAPLPPETHARFLARTGHSILERYGMTETLMSTSNPLDGARVAGSVGAALAGVSLRVRTADGTPVDGGAVGALEVRGPSVFAGYWRDPVRTQAAFTADGWFKTGDLGRIDEHGYLWLAGRSGDLIISGGLNVYPREVEEQLDAIPGVLESAVFGVPHADFGEAVTAAVVAETGAQLSEAALLAHLRTRLSAYKLPKRIVLLAELPRNAMGKVRKDQLRKSFAGRQA